MSLYGAIVMREAIWWLVSVVEFGEQMAGARGGACLVLATLHKSHGSPLRGSRLAVQ